MLTIKRECYAFELLNGDIYFELTLSSMALMLSERPEVAKVVPLRSLCWRGRGMDFNGALLFDRRAFFLSGISLF